MPRLVTRQQLADRFHVHPRTVDNWISKGLITAYLLPGNSKNVRVDLDEASRVLRNVPTTVARTGVNRWGPNAKVVQVPHYAGPALAVEPEADPDQSGDDQ